MYDGYSSSQQGNSCFIVLRQGPFATVQACYFKDKANPEASKAMLKFLGGITGESVIDIQVSQSLCGLLLSTLDSHPVLIIFAFSLDPLSLR